MAVVQNSLNFAPVRLKPTDADRKLWAFFQEHYALADSAIEAHYKQARNEDLELRRAAYRARDAGQAFDKTAFYNCRRVRLKHLVAHRRAAPLLDSKLPSIEAIQGKPCTIYARPRWHKEIPSTVIRIDCDAHSAVGGPLPDPDKLADAVCFLRFVKSNYCSSLYLERSPRGYSAYAVLFVPWYSRFPGASPRPMSSWAFNDHLRAVGRALRAMASAQGLRCTVELQGEFNVWSGQRLQHRAQHGRAPRCPLDHNIDELMAAQLEWHSLQNIIDAARSLPGVETPQHDLDSPSSRVASSGPPRQRRKWAPLTDTGDVFQNTLNALGPAVWAARTRNIADDAHQTVIVEHAMSLYEEAGLARGPERDRKRIERFERAFRWMIRQPAPMPTGNGNGPFFAKQDLDAAELYFRSTVPGHVLRRENERSDMRGALTWALLAFIACTVAKNSTMMIRGDCPANAIEQMLAYYGLPHHPQLVRAAVRVLHSHRHCTNDGKWFIGRSRRFKISFALAQRLPFLAHYMADVKLIDPTAAIEQASRYLPKAGGQMTPLFKHPVYCPLDQADIEVEPADWDAYTVALSLESVLWEEKARF